ncbi:hypothetical protein BDV38DRAFT_291190 [Aspergillus pseudotamarii]|uniref:Ribosomal RNA methyltransferase FtsJ domain-containing protein n=1 Tax=Aspergillus pseudotamarii TaxID=132259 RepID=A0A5N6SAY5_ASPPS|nr:uncharacterized protein BDV38DRAFT_291190 [Aspergillus pseudotamarii]KAE8130850.1 hypothetical protein BDV38DRAFT_291190 [Aspergillus pseudotamarii]
MRDSRYHMDTSAYVRNATPYLDLQATAHSTHCDVEIHRSINAIIQYLLREVPEYRRLSELREKGWQNPKGDRFFEKQRQTADHADEKTAKHFYNMMKTIGHDMNQLTDAFQIKSAGPGPHYILDMCMAPGGFLETALMVNPTARATGFSLPRREGGHDVRLQKTDNVSLRFLDITLLAADMGRVEIPNDHPDAERFLPRQFAPGQVFDVVICDGQVLRCHDRAAYREHREATRLTLTQLALGLEHVKPGGTLIVLLHKVEALDTVQLLYTFASFSSIQLYKHDRFHAKRSSFYLIATNIRSDGLEAATAVKEWKRLWDIATFGTDDMYHQTRHRCGPDTDLILEDFGPRLAMMGKHVWEIQAKALASAPFLK